MDKYMSFISKIQSGYKDITYHNKTHGADVAITTNYLLSCRNFWITQEISALEQAAVIIAGACHDHEHFGFNNVYLIENKHKLSILYNGKSLLTSRRRCP